MKVRIALLPKSEQSERLTQYSQALPMKGDGYRLDADHLPHITLVAWEVDGAASAEEVWHLLDDVFLPEVHCAVEGIVYENEGANGGYIMARIEGPDELKAFTRTVHEAITSKVGQTDLDKYTQRTPHLTIGVDMLGVSELPPSPIKALEFDRIALVESGGFGAATRIIYEQPLA
ncbi:hypothetical protein IT415_01800 [bacterium]|nr:hypothetical protein [bacterium]